MPSSTLPLGISIDITLISQPHIARVTQFNVTSPSMSTNFLNNSLVNGLVSLSAIISEVGLNTRLIDSS